MTTHAATLPASFNEASVATTPRQRFALGGGWLTVILALAMLFSMSGALSAAGWSENLDLVPAAVTGGALLGLLLALTRWGGAFSTAYSFLASLIATITLLRQGFFPDLNQHDAIQAIFQRNAAWVAALINRAPAADNLIFVTQLCLLSWWIGYFALWSLFRHRQILHAVIPAGVGLLVILYYSPLNLTGYLIVYLLAIILLAICVELALNQARWRFSQIRYAPDIFWDFLKAGTIFAVVVTTLAWVAPSGVGRATMERVLRPFDAPWHRFEQTWSRMYQSLRYQGPAVRTTKFGKSMGLGGPVNLTDRPIFQADVGRRVYWRGAAFDLYLGQSWQNTDEDLFIIERNQNLGEPAITFYSEITATILVLENGQDVIFGAPQPLRVSLPTNAEASQVTKEGNINISLLRSRVPLKLDSYYQVVSSVTDAPTDTLRTAGGAYPPWVLDRYLQLPDTLPDRVRQLAQTITAGQETPYDKAVAIEQYLRENFTYNQQISAPPAGADAVDYFIFSAKEGYCDYYASAMTIMLRAIGIPSRFIVGYTPGEAMQPQELMPEIPPGYRVLERNAHAWPEVYFPQYGWVQFEPTASEPLLARPVTRSTEAAAKPTPPAGNANPNPDEDLLPDQLGRVPLGAIQRDPPIIVWLREHWLPLTIGGGLTLLSLGAVLVLRWRRRAFFRSTELLARLFETLGNWATRFRVRWLPSDTPLERAAAFNQAIPEAQPMLGRLTGLFIAQRYGQTAPSPDAVAGLIEDWGQLEPILWQRWLARVANAERLRAKLRRARTERH